MASIANLPPELLLEIFEFLPLKDVLTLKDVNDDWASLTKYKCLYKEVTVNADVRLEELLKILSTYSKTVEMVTLTDRRDANVILKALSKCRNLKCLKMKNCGTDLDCVSTSLLINVFRKTSLSQFSIKQCTCFVHVLSILPPEPHTRKMVGFSSNATNSATQNLHFLGPHFFSMLQTSADSLTYLSIVDANINFLTTDFSALFRLIGNCRKLKELSYHVCYLPISDDNFYHLYNLHSLVSLSLKSLRRVSGQVFENFFQPDRTASIKYLELFDIGPLTASVIRHIGHGCPKLQDLTLYQFTGAREAILNREVVEELARSFTQLRSIRLSYVDESVIEALILLTKKLPFLKFIEFEVLTRSDFVFKLKSAMTECLSKFDVKFSRFGRVTCQLKRSCIIKSNFVSLDEQSVQSSDSITVSLGSWLNIPALPTVTLYNGNRDDDIFTNVVEKANNKNPIALPLWATLQCLGYDSIINDFIEKFESCQKLYNRLEKIPCFKMISQPLAEGSTNISVTDLISKPLVQNDIFDLVADTVVFKFLPENNDMWSSSYCDKLNSWLSQVLHRELPVVPINSIELKDYGTVLRYAPFAHTPLISGSDWQTFYVCLDQQLDILKSTVAQKETLYKLIQNSTCLKLVELPDWAGLGGVRYIPEAWCKELSEEDNKSELNRLNLQIVQQLRNTDAAFSNGESSDGFSCIRFGMIGWDSDVTDLINLVETVGKQEEESWNFIDTMAEVVKKGIETAMLDLQKENEEKLWQEGILRHVPVFGNIMNWWSPINKDNGGGIKGRSLDLTAGVIESTENIYRYHMQGASKTSDVKSPPQPSVQTPLTPTASRNTKGAVPEAAQ